MSGDKKTSQLDPISVPKGSDVLYIVHNMDTTPTSKRISLDNLFGTVVSNTDIKGTFTASANTFFNGDSNYFSYDVTVGGTLESSKFVVNSNGFVITDKLTPANSTVEAIEIGKFFYDDDYLYVKVANNTIKRVALSNF